VILEFARRGWLSPGCAAAGLALARDLSDAGGSNGQNRIDRTTDGQQRLSRVRDLVSKRHLDCLQAVCRDDIAPGAWARKRGLPERSGLVELRTALQAVRTVYITDDTE
jgi:hypothetical protein